MGEGRPPPVVVVIGSHGESAWFRGSYVACEPSSSPAYMIRLILLLLLPPSTGARKRAGAGTMAATVPPVVAAAYEKYTHSRSSMITCSVSRIVSHAMAPAAEGRARIATQGSSARSV